MVVTPASRLSGKHEDDPRLRTDDGKDWGSVPERSSLFLSHCQQTVNGLIL